MEARVTAQLTFNSACPMLQACYPGQRHATRALALVIDAIRYQPQ